MKVNETSEKSKFLRKVLVKCIVATEQTDYDAFFSYSPHCDAFQVWVSKKIDFKEWVYNTNVVSLTKEWGKRGREEVLTTLDKFIAGEYETEANEDELSEQLL